MISLPGISCLWELLILSFWVMAIRTVGDHKLQCVPARFSVPWCVQQVECGICAIFVGTCISLGKYCAYVCCFLGCPKCWGDLGSKSIHTGKEEVQVKFDDTGWISGTNWLMMEWKLNDGYGSKWDHPKRFYSILMLFFSPLAKKVKHATRQFGITEAKAET